MNDALTRGVTLMEFHSVLCPIDFSEASRIALREAVRIVRQFKAALHVVFVEDPLLAMVATARRPALPDLRDELNRFIVNTPDLDLPTDPILHVVSGEPAEEIIRLADLERADLIVLGSHGLAGVSNVFFGSTTARVLRRAGTSVVVVPAVDGTDKARDLTGLGSILVLCDFGPSAARAGRAAARLAATVGARLVLVHVMPSVSAPPSWSGDVEAAMQQRMADAHRQICGVMFPLEEHGPVESTIVRGNIPRRVAALVRSYHAGLIVIGLDADARGAHLGSTACAVIAAASVPVLTVPASATESSGRPLEREVAAPAHQ